MRDFIGAFQIARKTFESDIFYKKPDKWFKIWIFILGICNHEDNKQYKRGECLTTYSEIGYYTKANKNQIDHCIRWLKSATQIATRKTTRGFYIEVFNYDYYQTLNNYKKIESETKSDTKGELKAKQKRNRSDTILKNDNNDKNVKNEILATEVAEIKPLIGLFKNVNPSYKTFYYNKTQRSCLHRLLKELGIEKLTSAIQTLEKTNTMEYAPIITTPHELERKLGSLMAFIQKKQINNSNIITI